MPIALSAWQKMFNEQIQEAFRGYTVAASVLNASQFGVPQIRRRAFVVGIRADPGVPAFDFPRGDFDEIGVGHDSHSEAKAAQRFVTVEDAIGDLPPLKAGEERDGVAYPSEPARIQAKITGTRKCAATSCVTAAIALTCGD